MDNIPQSASVEPLLTSTDPEMPSVPPNHVHSRWSYIVLGVFGLLTLCLVGIIVFAPNQQSSDSTFKSFNANKVKKVTATPVPTSAVDISGWKTYTNDKYGYSIKYPNDKLTRCTNAIHGFPDSFDLRLDKECSISEPAIVISILAFDAPRPELTSSYPQCYTYTKEQIKIGQIDGYKYSPVIKKETGECTMTSYGLTDQIEFADNNNYFSIRVFNTVENNSYQILSTFKFTDQNQTTVSPTVLPTKAL